MVTMADTWEDVISSRRAAWINYSKYTRGAILTEPVVCADGGVAANPFARKLVVPLSSQQLEVEGLLKLARGISVEPNPQGDLAFGRHDPAERHQAAREQIKNPQKRVSQPNRHHVASFPPAVSPPNLCCRFCSSVAWLLTCEVSLQVDSEEMRDRLFVF